MIFLLIYTYILIITFISIIQNKNNLYLLFPVLVLISFILLFKFGQGVDYFNYLYVINNTSEVIANFLKSGNYENRYEFGFSLINYFFVKILNFSLENVISIYSIIIFSLFLLAIKKFSKNYALSLLFFLGFYFFIYNFSAIRQGLSLSLYMYFLFPLLIRSKFKMYIIGVLLLTLIHTSSLVLLLLVFKNYINIQKINVIVIFIISLLIGLVGNNLILMIINILPINIGLSSYVKNGGIEIFSVLLRVIVFLIIYNGFNYIKNTLTKEDVLMYEIYYMGFFLYLLLMYFPTISSRITIYFRIFEFILLGNILINLIRKKNITFEFNMILILTLSLTMFIKSIDTEIKLGDYNDDVNVLNFPILLNKQEALNYRSTRIDLDHL